MLIAKPDGYLPGKTAAGTIPFLVGELCGVVVVMRINRVERDPRTQRRHAVKRSEHERGVYCRPDEAEVPAHHQNGVEDTEARVDGGKGKDANIPRSSPPAHLDRSRRDVDRDDVEPAPLGLEGVPPSPAADVENAPAHELEHLLLLSGPLALLGEEDVRRKPRSRAAVVELEGQRTGLARQMIEEQTPESVFLL